MKKTLNMRPLNLQLFAEPAGTGNPVQGAQSGQGAGQSNSQQTVPQIDYAKIQQMLDGTLAAKEDTALKAYFKQQGLSQQEAEQAMNTFKQQKAANQPDVNAIQTQLTQSQEIARKVQIENAAILEAVSLGVDVKTIPYLIKLADMSQVMGEDGKVNHETLKNSLNKVLEDIPGLKPAVAAQSGFMQVGTSGAAGQTSTTEDQIAAAFGNTKK